MEGAADEAWDCFIAYPAQQRAVAEQLAGHLGPRVRVFFDRHALRPGDDWPQAIAAAIEASVVMVVIVAPETERAFYEQEEITSAVQRARRAGGDRRVVPIFVDGMTPTDPRVPYGVRIKQGYTITSPDDLVRAAEAIATTTEEITQRLEMDSGGESRDISEAIRSHLASMRIEVDQLTRDQYRVINQLRYMRRVRISVPPGRVRRWSRPRRQHASPPAARACCSCVTTRCSPST